MVGQSIRKLSYLMMRTDGKRNHGRQGWDPVTAGSPRVLRGINDRAALELLLEHGPLSRSQLGDLTGLSER